MNDAKEFLKEDGLVGFFDGCYWPGENAEVNHYDNLSVNIIKPEKSLETSHLFTNKIERMERNKNEVKRAKIYSDGKLIVMIEKNDKQQRNYRFAKDATCDMKIRWSAEDEKGNSVNCFISLNVNPSEIEIGQLTINGKDVELDEILKLARQNKDVLMEGKALHEFLEGYLEQDAQSQKKECIITLNPSSHLLNSLKPGELQAGCIGGAYDHYLLGLGLKGHLQKKNQTQSIDLMIVFVNYTLNLKCIISPSCTTYSLPSKRTLPASLQANSLLYFT